MGVGEGACLDRGLHLRRWGALEVLLLKLLMLLEV